MMNMLVLSIIGKSKSVKTTLIEKLIPELNSRGFRVGTVKHAHHGFEIDHPGKDSFRHREAGAETVVLYSKDKIAIQRNIQEKMSLNEIIQTYFPANLDVILVEGFKEEQGLKIEVGGDKDIDVKEVLDLIEETISSRKKGGVKMKGLCLLAGLSVFMLTTIGAAYALAPEEEIGALKEQVKVLLDRVEKLEGEVAKTKEAKPEEKVAEKKEEPLPAMLKNVGTKLKISGRWAAGYYDSLENGSFPDGSFQAPEAKLRFDFSPDKINTITMRLNLNNATFNNLDYFYLDSKDFLPFLKDTPFTLESRIGRFKLDYGEETWSNNQVESAVISNSAANVAGNDEGVQLSGKIKVLEKMPIKWSTSVTNGNSGTGADNENSRSEEHTSELQSQF